MNRTRKEKSGGQALVMVTLALIAMTGIMGLAVDLGWSFFVQKEAQSAADGAALAAVQEAITQIRASGTTLAGFNCALGIPNVACATTAVACSSATLNLSNGCLYAKQNGFDYTVASSRQNVTIQANSTSPPPTAPGVNVSYWVTVRTVQTIPQLFSAVLGNTTGTVSAVATAGIVGTVVPGSFFGMNRQGDCITDPGLSPDCGVDIDGSHGQKFSCISGPKADVCAPAGFVLASDCSASGNGCSTKYAGDGGGAGAVGGSLTVMGNGSGGGGAVNNFVNNSGGTLTPTYSTTPSTFQDPLAGTPQPPLQVPASPIGSCGYLNGIIPAGSTVGPYQYYSYRFQSGLGNVPDGNMISLSNNVTFSNSGGCTGPGAIFTPGATSGSGSGQSTAFPSYIFWGGLNAAGNNANFGPGQYVMAGTTSTSGTVFDASAITGDQTTGTMFVFTDGNYPGLTNQSGGIPGFGANMPPLYQGNLGPFKNANVDVYGLVNSANATSALPQALDAYSGIVMWQDRRNSTVGYNQGSGTAGCPGCTGDDGSVIYCAMGCKDGAAPTSLIDQANPRTSSNHVTNTSPAINMDPGNGRLGLHGVLYQPRGAWIHITAGNASVACAGNAQCPLQVITGALVLEKGTAALLLAGPTNSLLAYKAALIQ